MGDQVMVRNFRPGPDWIPGTITVVLGPVTYTVNTDDGHQWKRHTDQIKSWIASTAATTEADCVDTEVPSFPEDPEPEVPEDLFPESPSEGDTPPDPVATTREDAAGITESASTTNGATELSTASSSAPQNSSNPTGATSQSRKYPKRKRKTREWFVPGQN